MKRILLFAFLALSCGGGGAAVKRPTGVASDLAIVGATIVPMNQEGTIQGTILIRDGKILAVGDVDPGRAIVIDGRGKWVVPGLADMHVHLMSDADLRLLLLNGVTTARNMFGSPEHVKMRDRVAAGEVLGPTLITAGPIVDGDPPTWPGSDVVTTVEDAARVVKAQKEAGYDFIKVYANLKKDVHEAIVRAARAEGLAVDGHVPGTMTIEEALASGQRSIEHLDGYVRFSKDVELPADIAARTAKSGVWNCPTLIVTRNLALLEDPSQLSGMRGLEHVPPWLLGMWDPTKDFRFKDWTPERFERLRAANVRRNQIVADLARAGANLVLGTDTGNPYVIAGFAVHEELKLLVAAGLTPRQALHMATVAPGKMLGQPVGTIAVGQRADLLVVGGDPLKDLGALAEPEVVVVRGRPLTRVELLSGSKEAAAERVPPPREEGEVLARARYELKFNDNVYGEERLVLSRGPIVNGVQSVEFPRKAVITYRATTTEARIDDVEVKWDGKQWVASTGATLALPADAILAPQTLAEFIWIAQRVDGKDKLKLEAVEVMTEGGVSLDAATFELTKTGDRAWDFTGTHGRMTFSGTLTVDPDGLPREVVVKLRMGTVTFRRTE